MIWTHVWWCGRWVWRLLTPAQWVSLPHVTKAVGGVAIVCAGVAVPPTPIPEWHPRPEVEGARPIIPYATPLPTPIELLRDRRFSPVTSTTPAPATEPSTLALMTVALVGLVIVKRRRTGS